jgi:hypothetical protein
VGKQREGSAEKSRYDSRAAGQKQESEMSSSKQLIPTQQQIFAVDKIFPENSKQLQKPKKSKKTLLLPLLANFVGRLQKT